MSRDFGLRDQDLVRPVNRGSLLLVSLPIHGMRVILADGVEAVK